jgi:hypothetical protein
MSPHWSDFYEQVTAVNIHVPCSQVHRGTVARTKRQAQEKIVNQLLAAQKRSAEATDFECFGVV